MDEPLDQHLREIVSQLMADAELRADVARNPDAYIQQWNLTAQAIRRFINVPEPDSGSVHHPKWRAWMAEKTVLTVFAPSIEIVATSVGCTPPTTALCDEESAGQAEAGPAAGEPGPDQPAKPSPDE